MSSRGFGIPDRGWKRLGLGFEDGGGSRDANLGAELLRGSAERQLSRCGRRGTSGSRARAAGPARGVVGPTGTPPANVLARGRQSPNTVGRNGQILEGASAASTTAPGHSQRTLVTERGQELRHGNSRRSAIGHVRAGSGEKPVVGGGSRKHGSGQGGRSRERATGLVRRWSRGGSVPGFHDRAISKPCLGALGGEWLQGARSVWSQERSAGSCFGILSLESGPPIG